MPTSPRFRRAPNVVFQHLDPEDGAVLLHIDSGTYHGVNPVGARIWDLLESPRSPDEIGDALASEFEVEREVVDQDVEEFLEGLRERELILQDAAE